MARLTPITLADAQNLATGWGLCVTAVEALAAGSVNSNFRFRLNTGQSLFARIYEEQGEEGAFNELMLLRALEAAGVPVAAPLQRQDGAYLASHTGKPFAVFPWFEGDIVCQARVSAEHCEQVGASLAQVHLATPASPSLGLGRFQIADWGQRLQRVEQAGRLELLPAVGRIQRAIDHYAPQREASLPEGVIHGDLFRDNVLWRGQSLLSLLDFESACRGPFAYDLMVTMLAWCFSSQFELPLVSALLQGYSNVRPLVEAEVVALPVEAALGCLRFACTRLTDYSLRVPPGVDPLRDFGRFLRRLEAIEAGALAPCFAELARQRPVTNQARR